LKIHHDNDDGGGGLLLILFSDWWSGAGDIKLIDCDDDEEDDDSYLSDEAGDRRYKVVFHLYGVTQADIDKVIKEIDELGNEAVSDRVLESAENQAHIAKLTADQVIHVRRFPLDIFRGHSSLDTTIKRKKLLMIPI